MVQNVDKAKNSNAPTPGLYLVLEGVFEAGWQLYGLDGGRLGGLGLGTLQYAGLGLLLGDRFAACHCAAVLTHKHTTHHQSKLRRQVAATPSYLYTY